jgi:alpha-ketoglutarate-dependent taurine dioxygenase
MAIAYAALPPDTKRRIEGFKAENDFEYAMVNVGKVLTEGERRATPPVVHPLVRRHPETGVRSLFVGTYSRAIVGMPQAQGRR